MAYNNQQHESAGQTAGTSFRQASEIGEGLADKASEQLERARSGIEGVTGDMSQRGREAADNAQAVLGNFRGAVEKSTRDHPLTTLVMAVAMGFLVGTMWR